MNVPGTPAPAPAPLGLATTPKPGAAERVVASWLHAGAMLLQREEAKR